LKWSEFIKDYLTFTRKERIGTLVIVGLMIFVLFLPDILSNSTSNIPTKIDTAWMAAVKKLEIIVPDSLGEYYQKNDDEDAYAYQYDKTKSSYDVGNVVKGELFYFDPNTLSISEWKRLGLRDKTIQTIEKYLSKGGHFYKPDDLQKIYGLRAEEYDRLAPYLKIKSTAKSNEPIIFLPRLNIVNGQIVRPQRPRGMMKWLTFYAPQLSRSLSPSVAKVHLPPRTMTISLRMRRPKGSRR